MRLYAVIVTLFAAVLAVIAIGLAFDAATMEEHAYRAVQVANERTEMLNRCMPMVLQRTEELESCWRALNHCRLQEVSDPCL